MVLSALALAGCARPHVSPLAPPPYRAEIPAAYARTWSALVRAFARENLPLRAIARDSGVIASDDFVTPIGLWADCGTIGDDRLEGEALVSFTLFAEANGADSTRVQLNSKMRTQGHPQGLTPASCGRHPCIRAPRPAASRRTWSTPCASW